MPIILDHVKKRLPFRRSALPADSIPSTISAVNLKKSMDMRPVRMTNWVNSAYFRRVCGFDLP